MGQDATGDLNLSSRCLRGQVRRGRLEEEEGLFRNWAVDFLDVVEVVATDGGNLERAERV